MSTGADHYRLAEAAMHDAKQWGYESIEYHALLKEAAVHAQLAEVVAVMMVGDSDLTAEGEQISVRKNFNEWEPT